MTYKIFTYSLLALVLANCKGDSPTGIYIEELRIRVDESEVTAVEFQEFRNKFDVKIASDSLAGAVYSMKDSSWVKSNSLNHLFPVSDSPADSLAPAVQVSWADACAYCNAKNGRLPTASEWEILAEGDYLPGNIWEGFFPLKDEGLDGFRAAAAPVKSFKPDSRGLYDIHGNVWEWTSTSNGKGGYFIKGGSFLSDYNEGGFIPSYQKILDPNTLKADLGFRCVYQKK